MLSKADQRAASFLRVNLDWSLYDSAAPNWVFNNASLDDGFPEHNAQDS
jgi:hypothetical protein